MAARLEKLKNAPGIYRRHRKDCSGRGDCGCPYQATVYSPRDRKHIRKQFDRLAEAKTWQQDARGLVRSGRMRTPRPTTLAEAWETYKAGMLDGTILNRNGEPYKPSACRSYERAMRLRVLPFFGPVKLSAVTRRDVQDFVDSLVAKGVDGSTIKNTLNPLQAIFRRAVRRDEIMINPTRELELPRARGRRDRVPVPSEAARLIAALPESERALWATAIYTGLRRGELQALRWSDIDLTRDVIHVERAWDDEGRQAVDVKTEAGVRMALVVAPLKRELVEHGLRTRRAGDDLVFGRTATDPFVPTTVRRRALDAWEAANKKALERAAEEGRDLEPGELLVPVTLHEGRHAAATNGGFARLPDKSLAYLMGHSSVVITKDRYGHMTDEALTEAKRLLDGYYERALTDQRDHLA